MAAKKAAKMVTVTQVRSAIRRPENQTAILRGLGLKKLNKPRQLEDTPAVRGMIHKISHLLRVEEA